jgi:hypothetical protein
MGRVGGLGGSSMGRVGGGMRGSQFGQMGQTDGLSGRGGMIPLTQQYNNSNDDSNVNYYNSYDVTPIPNTNINQSQEQEQEQ